MTTDRRWALVALVILATAGLAAVALYWSLTRVVPGPWRAEHTAQRAADRVAPDLLDVYSASWSLGLGDWTVRAALRDDPDAEVRWTMPTSGTCGPSCEARIPAAITAGRERAEETRMLRRAFDGSGCPLVGLQGIGRSQDRLTAHAVVTRSLADTSSAGPVLDACLRAWARERAGRDDVAVLALDVRLTDAVPQLDADEPLVSRLAEAWEEPGAPTHSSASGEADAGGRTLRSTESTLAPLRAAGATLTVHPTVEGHVRGWLAAQGLPDDPYPAVNAAYERYAPGTVDRVREYVFLRTRGGAGPGAQAVALTVDLDGSRPSDVRFVDVVDGAPVDPGLR